ncbi:MAG: hypothetical protein FJ276_12455, partial [Planctomycetes bacterium]|nr:hypothetical protein [Planctomycetota bacterium]
GEPFAEPVIGDDRIYVSARSGKIHVVNPETGTSDRHVKVPQSLTVGVGLGSNRPYIYQVGEHDSLYVLSAETLQCAEVFYIGHSAGTVQVPPVMALGYLFVVVNNAGADSCAVHVIASDENGLKLKTAQRVIQLRGQMLVPPIVDRRRVLFVTDRRAVELYDVDPNNESGTPVTTAGRHNATAEAAITSYAMLEGGYMWVANNRLTKYQVQASTGKLPSEWSQDEQDVYVAPLRLLRDAVVHVRRRQGAEGFTVAATRASDKNPAWQTEIAAPLRLIGTQGESVSVVTGRGRVYAIGAEQLAGGLVGQAAATATRDERLVLSLAAAIDVGNGETAFAAESGYNQIVFHKPGAENGGLRMLTLTVPPGDATCLPVPFAGGLLVPVRTGLVMLADTTTGADRMNPFQPDVPAGASTNWGRPAVVDGGQEFVVADDRQHIYRVGMNDNPAPQLKELGYAQLGSNIVGPLATTGTAVYGVTRTAGGDAVHCFTPPDLKPAKETSLGGRVLWGPERCGDLVLLATDTELVCWGGEADPRWKTPLEHAPVVGRPLVDAGHVLLASGDGFVTRIEAASGKTLAAVAAGEPLSAGPVRYGDKLLVAGQGGTLLVIVSPNP